LGNRINVMVDTQALIENAARSLFAAHHWRDGITETVNQRLSQEGYEQRACARWDSGNAGEVNYSKFRRLSEIAFPIFSDAILSATAFDSPLVLPVPQIVISSPEELVKAA
jgi:hypothetical protein